MTAVAILRTKVDQLRGRQMQIQDNIDSLEKLIKKSKKKLNRYHKAREIIIEVGMKTQQQLQYQIGDITTLALTSVLTDPYELSVNFVQRRNKTECDLVFVRDGHEVDPVEASGLGAVDVASFALRVASWSMMKGKISNTIILDEPMRWLSEDNRERASKMIKEISDKLGIQFIIVTHEETLTTYADRIFLFYKRNGITKFKRL